MPLPRSVRRGWRRLGSFANAVVDGDEMSLASVLPANRGWRIILRALRTVGGLVRMASNALRAGMSAASVVVIGPLRTVREAITVAQVAFGDVVRRAGFRLGRDVSRKIKRISPRGPR